MSVRVLIVDDQALVRAGFRLILSAEDGITVVGEAADGAAGVDLALSLEPDVVLMDVQLPVLDGIAATRRIVAATRARVVVLTTFDRDDYLFAALEAGAGGFLLKNSSPERLVEAVRLAATGDALLDPSVTARVIRRFAATGAPLPGPAPADGPGADPLPDPPPAVASGPAGGPGGTLTPREREVLALVADGLSNQEIAARLVVGEATVKTHVSHLLTKLSARDRVQLVVLALRDPAR